MSHHRISDIYRLYKTVNPPCLYFARVIAVHSNFSVNTKKYLLCHPHVKQMYYFVIKNVTQNFFVLQWTTLNTKATENLSAVS